SGLICHLSPRPLIHVTPPLSSWMTRSTMLRCAMLVRAPTRRTTMASFAVKSFPGRAKLLRGRPPSENEAGSRDSTFGSPYGLLVIWHSTQSVPPAAASTRAGRSLEDERSEKGKRTRTTTPALSPPTLRLPQDGPN